MGHLVLNQNWVINDTKERIKSRCHAVLAVQILENSLANPILQEIRMSAELRHKNSFPIFGVQAVYKISNIE